MCGVLQLGNLGFSLACVPWRCERTRHSGGRVRIAKGGPGGAYRPSIPIGTSIGSPRNPRVTSRQVVFKSHERTVHFAYDELWMRSTRWTYPTADTPRQTPNHSEHRGGKLVTILIGIFPEKENTFRDGRLPRGLVVSARPNASGSGVD